MFIILHMIMALSRWPRVTVQGSCAWGQGRPGEQPYEAYDRHPHPGLPAAVAPQGRVGVPLLVVVVDLDGPWPLGPAAFRVVEVCPPCCSS